MDRNSGVTVLFITDAKTPDGELVRHILGKERGDTVITCKPDEQKIQIILNQKLPEFILIQGTLFLGLTPFQVYEKLRSIPDFAKTPILFWRVAVEPAEFYPKAQDVGAAGCVDFYGQPAKLLAARDTILKGGTYYP